MDNVEISVTLYIQNTPGACINYSKCLKVNRAAMNFIDFVERGGTRIVSNLPYLLGYEPAKPSVLEN